jgi:hypothetical protein
VDSKVDGERDHDNMAGKSLEMASPAEALAALGWAADAKGCGRAVTSLIWEHIINPFGRFGLDMGGKPGSISVQMAPGDCCRKVTLRTRKLCATLSREGIRVLTRIRCAFERAC